MPLLYLKELFKKHMRHYVNRDLKNLIFCSVGQALNKTVFSNSNILYKLGHTTQIFFLNE